MKKKKIKKVRLPKLILSNYEKLQERNIRERKHKFNELGIEHAKNLETSEDTDSNIDQIEQLNAALVQILKIS